MKLLKLRIFQKAGFTLVELMVSTAIIGLLVALLLTMMTQSNSLLLASTSKVEQFQQARTAYESMTRRISYATLNTYWDYVYPTLANGDPDKTKPPLRYQRQSELHFRSLPMTGMSGDGAKYRGHGIFFQAPIGMIGDDKSLDPLDNLLNSWGYFLEVGPGGLQVPPFLRASLPKRTEARLMEFSQPTDDMNVYTMSGRTDDWFTAPLARPARPVTVLADNIVALIIAPRLSRDAEKARLTDRTVVNSDHVALAPLYDYDSRRTTNYGATFTTPVEPELNPLNQLPPVVHVSMVAIDKTSSERLVTHPSGNALEELTELLEERFSRGSNVDAHYLEGSILKAASNRNDLALMEEDIQTFAASKSTKITYRIFSSNISIRGARWSRWSE